MDLFDIREALKGGKRAIYFRDTARGTQRAARAMTSACNQLGRWSLVRYGLNGGLVLMEANTGMFEELEEVIERFRKALPDGASTILGRVGHYDVDPW